MYIYKGDMCIYIYVCIYIYMYVYIYICMNPACAHMCKRKGRWLGSGECVHVCNTFSSVVARPTGPTYSQIP